ncbi:MAG TPA: MBL fold metallo-hydrolase [Thermoanaerobaculia bacterium]|nr:MBL fold metallo-hydrolase [Thermoanaerobaculia bacterium]
MRMTVLGCSGGYPTAENPCSGYLLEQDGARIWLDAGTGTFAALQRVADYTRLEALVLSHIHPDHCLDFYPFYIARRFHPEELSKLPVYGPPGIKEVLAGLMVGEGIEKIERWFDFRAVDEGDEVEVGGLRLTFARMSHTIHTLAVRAEGAGSLTYSADTGPEADLAGFARGSDFLLCEATYQEGRVGAPVHLSARQAGDTARRAGVRQLALTHHWPTFDPEVSLSEGIEAAGEVRVHLARPGVTFEV